MDELMEDGVYIALPIAAREIDMLAFVDSRTVASTSDGGTGLSQQRRSCKLPP
jgi:hypothetical protein